MCNHISRRIDRTSDSARILFKPEQVWRPCMQASDQVLQTRIVHLPMAFNDKWTNDAIAKYMKSVRLSGLGLHRHECRIARAACSEMLPACHDGCHTK